MRKVCVVITARPSYSRIRSALEALKGRDDIELQVVAAASALLDRYGSVFEEIERDGFEIASKVYMVLEGEQPLTMAKTTGIGMIELATALDNLQPDFVVTIARRETSESSIAARTFRHLLDREHFRVQPIAQTKFFAVPSIYSTTCAAANRDRSD